jgi:UDP-glucose 4-epimerase
MSKYFEDIRNLKNVYSIFSTNKFSDLIHLATLKSVEKSQQFPDLYEENDLRGTRKSLNVMVKYGVKNLKEFKDGFLILLEIIKCFIKNIKKKF